MTTQDPPSDPNRALPSPNTAFWSGRRVLVTGGSGFIGSHLTRRLVALGAETAILTKYLSTVDNVRVIDLWERLRVIEADLRNPDSLGRLRDWEPQIIYHLAAYNHVGDSFLHVSEALDCNLKGTANLCHALGGYERLVYISTSEVYGKQEGVPFHEKMTPQPISPYAVGKYAGELYVRMLMEQKGHPIVVLRPFNAFGPYQSLRAVIPEIVVTCLGHQPVRATTGRQTREFNPVDNLVDGFILAGELPQAVGEVINLGCGEEIAIRDLLHQLRAATDSHSELLLGALPTRPTEIWRMAADASHARRLLGWTPRLTFQEGIRKTVDWYREYLKLFHGQDSPLIRLATGGPVASGFIPPVG